MGKQKLSSAQKQHLLQFIGITGASKEQATECLQANQWNVEVAINHFFNAGLTGAPPVDNSAVTRLYEQYRDQQQDAILAEGARASLRLSRNSQERYCKSHHILQVLVSFAKTSKSILQTL